MIEFPYPILEELFRVLMIGAIGVEYPGKGVGPPPFDAEHPSPVGHPLAGMVSESPIPLFWGGVDVDDDAPNGNAGSTCAGVWSSFGGGSGSGGAPALVVVLPPVVHTVEVGGGS
jgi:hypothetical protein